MKNSARIAVVLSGCGHQDGTEIQEAVLTLLAIEQNGAQYLCYAPNIQQYQVINHLNGNQMPEKRNVLIESARIVRGEIQDLKDFDPELCDGVIFPGGMGAVKNLSDFMSKGPGATIHPEVRRVIKAMYARAKPIGALCIAPTLVVAICKHVTVTVGQSEKVSSLMRGMGATVENTQSGEIAIDWEHKIVSAPCYMHPTRISEIAAETDKVVRILLEMMHASREPSRYSDMS